MAPFAAKKTGHRVWPVTEFLGGFFYALFRGWRDVARQRRIVQHDRNRGGREAAGLRDIPHGDGLVLCALPLHAWASLRNYHLVFAVRIAMWRPSRGDGAGATRGALQTTWSCGNRMFSKPRKSAPGPPTRCLVFLPAY